MCELKGIYEKDVLHCAGVEEDYDNDQKIIYNKGNNSKWALVCDQDWHLDNEAWCCGDKEKTDRFSFLHMEGCGVMPKAATNFTTNKGTSMVDTFNILKTSDKEYIHCSESWNFDGTNYSCPGMAKRFGDFSHSI